MAPRSWGGSILGIIEREAKTAREEQSKTEPPRRNTDYRAKTHKHRASKASHSSKRAYNEHEHDGRATNCTYILTNKHAAT
jgi:hypothetical protein